MVHPATRFRIALSPASSAAMCFRNTLAGWSASFSSDSLGSCCLLMVYSLSSDKIVKGTCLGRLFSCALYRYSWFRGRCCRDRPSSFSFLGYSLWGITIALFLSRSRALRAYWLQRFSFTTYKPIEVLSCIDLSLKERRVRVQRANSFI